VEQERGPRPSRQVLAALARALMLSADERVYLFRLGGQAVTPSAGPSRTVPPGIAHLLDLLPSTPPQFAAMWAAQEVSERHSTVKQADHPLFGPLKFSCEVLHIADTDQRLIVYVAER
jgi:hypothetical protein